jgi:hypothetical protein
LESGKFGPFFQWKILCIGWNYIFKVEIWENFPPNKNAGLKNRLYQNWTIFGEDSFHHFLLWRISFNFAKCFCEKFGNVAQLRFFFWRMG